MRIAIAGATGAVGRLLTTQALEAGHEVVALVRRPEAVSARPGLVAKRVDFGPDRPVAMDAFDGVEAVVSCLGNTLRGAGSRNKFLASAHRSLLAAAREADVSRFVTMLSVGAGPTFASSPLAVRVLLRATMRAEFRDLDAVVDAVRASALDWRIVFFGALHDGAGTGKWTIEQGFVRPRRYRIARADLAEALLRTAKDHGAQRTPLVISGATR